MEVEGWSGLSEDLKKELRTLLAASASAVNPSLLLRHRHADPSYVRCQEGTLGDREVGGNQAQLIQLMYMYKHT